MTITLTSEQGQALGVQATPVRAIDPNTGREYVVLTNAEYERLRSDTINGAREPAPAGQPDRAEVPPPPPAESDEEDERPWRGVFVLPKERKPLFSITFTTPATEWPQWQPQLTLGRRGDEDE